VVPDVDTPTRRPARTASRRIPDDPLSSRKDVAQMGVTVHDGLDVRVVLGEQLHAVSRAATAFLASSGTPKPTSRSKLSWISVSPRAPR